MHETDSRKRPLAEQTAPPPTKKRAVSDAHGSPVLVNGAHAHTPTPPPDEPRGQDSLEVRLFPPPTAAALTARPGFVFCAQLFRKEAIFRRMRHYARAGDRSAARVAELERLTGSYEASLALMGACWTQVRPPPARSRGRRPLSHADCGDDSRPG